METETEQPTITAVVGMNLRRLREANRWTQDETARLLRYAGLGLSQSAIVAIEAGTRSVALGELVVIASTLGASVEDLLAGDGSVMLSRSAKADLPSVRAFLVGGVDEVEIDSATPPVPWPAIVAASKAQAARMKRLWPGARPAQIVAAERAADLAAERKAARSLGIPPLEVSVRAFQLWGCSLTDKLDSLVGERTDDDASPRRVQAIKGRITRDLLTEIQTAMERN